MKFFFWSHNWRLLIYVSSPNFQKLNVHSIYIYWYINMPNVTASYGIPFYFILSSFWIFIHNLRAFMEELLFSHQIFTDCIYILVMPLFWCTMIPDVTSYNRRFSDLLCRFWAFSYRIQFRICLKGFCIKLLRIVYSANPTF